MITENLQDDPIENDPIEKIMAMSPLELVVQATQVRLYMKMSGQKEMFFPHSHVNSFQSERDPDSMEIAIIHGKLTYRVIPDKEHFPARVTVMGPDGLITPSMFPELTSFKPETIVAPGGITAGEIFGGLRQFILDYVTGKPMDPETYYPASPAEWGNYISFLVASGRLAPTDLDNFIAPYRNRTPATDSFPPSEHKPGIGITPVIAEKGIVIPNTDTLLRSPLIPGNLPPSVKNGLGDTQPQSTSDESIGDRKEEQDELTAEEIVIQLEAEKPMTKEFDTKMERMLANFVTEVESLTATLETATGQEWRDAYERYITLVGLFQRSITARGRTHTGQVGEWFWETSSVRNLGETVGRLGGMVSTIGQNPRVAAVRATENT